MRVFRLQRIHRRVRTLSVAMLVACWPLLATCDDVGGPANVAAKAPTTSSLLSMCQGAPYPVASASGFRHTRNRLLAAVSHPQHSAQDMLQPLDVPLEIPGKFAYGRFSKDLEHEDVRVSLHDCSAWTQVGTATTNGDGRTATAAQPALGFGVYDVVQEVLGDASTVLSTLRLLPRGTHLVVFDVDGTLTTSDAEVVTDAIDAFFLPIYKGQYVPKAYPSAAELTRLYADKGYVVVYLTGRPYWLTKITREWLAALDFAPGHLHFTDSNGEAIPIDSAVGAYKRDYLLALQWLGYVIDYAYGNASTDISAYAAAGIPADRTFIIGVPGGQQGTQAVSDGYSEHLTVVAAHADAVQPFRLP